MTVEQLVRKYFSFEEADYFLYNRVCLLCQCAFEPDITTQEMYQHLKVVHPTLKEFK